MRNAWPFRTEPPDPLRRWQRRALAAALVSGGVLVGLGRYATRPLPPLPTVAAAAPALLPAPAITPRAAPLDCSGFTRELWTPTALTPAAAAPAAPAAPASPPLALALDLLAIADLDGTLSATLFDRARGGVVSVRAGGQWQDVTVADLTRDTVVLTRGDARLTLPRRREPR